MDKKGACNSVQNSNKAVVWYKSNFIIFLLGHYTETHAQVCHIPASLKQSYGNEVKWNDRRIVAQA